MVPRLRGRFGRPYVYAEVCPSTQRLLGPEHSEGAVAVAEEQTEGRGRLGRRWVSPPGVSVLCSILLEPPVETHRLPELSLVAGEACAEAISTVTGLTAADQASERHPARRPQGGRHPRGGSRGTRRAGNRDQRQRPGGRAPDGGRPARDLAARRDRGQRSTAPSCSSSSSSRWSAATTGGSPRRVRRTLLTTGT